MINGNEINFPASTTETQVFLDDNYAFVQKSFTKIDLSRDLNRTNSQVVMLVTEPYLLFKPHSAPCYVQI